MPYESMDIFADKILEEQSNEGSLPNDVDVNQLSATSGSDQQARVEDGSNEDHKFHDNDIRTRIEDELDQNCIYFQDFPGIREVYRMDGDIPEAYLESHHHQHNPVYPFVSKMDWEIACWANEEGPRQAAFTQLPNIDGVSLLS